MGGPKQKIKSYFKVKESSQIAADLMRMFILPFMKVWNPLASVDEAVMAFFAVNDRRIFYGTATRGFRMPGEVAMAGAKYSKRALHRDVVKGQKMILVMDRVDGMTKIDIKLAEKEYTFRLTRGEMNFLTECLEIEEA